jgi:hypothetical protein
MPISVHAMAWPGEQHTFIVKEFIQNGGSPIMMQRAFCSQQTKFPVMFS